jgi:hypothetical protein
VHVLQMKMARGVGKMFVTGCFKTTYCGRDVECCKSCFEEYIGECGDGDCDTCLMGRAQVTSVFIY